MRLVLLSDTHELHDKVVVPDGDMLIHCGDFTNRGFDPAIEKFLTWFASHPHANKIFISGNHELGLDLKGPNRKKKIDLINSFQDKYDNLFYLENSSQVVNGLEIYGSPHQPWFHDWAWNVHRGPAIAKCWAQIPDSTQVLITHGPPYGILDLIEDDFESRDLHQGCQDLTNRIHELSNLKLHAFGHLHYQGGTQVTIDGKIFANAAICDDRYKTTHSPVIVDL